VKVEGDLRNAALSPTLQQQAKSFQDFWQTVKAKRGNKTSSEEQQAVAAKALKAAGFEVD
jgi:3-methyladenine DNA glycosylase Tag